MNGAMENITGHNEIKKILTDTVKSGKINHAYIFEGKEGVGRLSLALAFASMITGNGEKFTPDSDPDIKVVTNAVYDHKKKQKNLLIATVRAMKNEVYFKPYASERKVYIVPNSDSMQAEAQNCLLKVFEEPPEYCTIILIAANANSLLDTIRSRAISLRIQPNTGEEVCDYLIKNGFKPEKAKILSAMCGGSIGRAIALSKDDDAVALREQTINHLIEISKSGHKPLYDFIKFLKQNKVSIDLITDIMTDWSRDVLHIKINKNTEIVNADKADELKRFSVAVTYEAAYKFLEIIAKYTLGIKRNANYQIAAECMATEYWEEIHGRNYRSAF